MDPMQKLREVQRQLPDSRKEEHKIINQLIFLVFGSEIREFPKEFQIRCNLDNDAVEKFLEEYLEMNVKEVRLVPVSLIVGEITFDVVLN